MAALNAATLGALAAPESPASTCLTAAELAPIVRRLHEQALARLDVEVRAARAEADAVVAAAVAKAAAVLTGSPRPERESAAISATTATSAAWSAGIDAPIAATASGRRSLVIDLEALEADGPGALSTLGLDGPLGELSVDGFWAEVPPDAPVRDRLRRWLQREA